MSEEQQPAEVGAEVSLTEGGLSVSLRSRFVATLDQLGARWLARKSKPENRALLVEDAITSAQLAIIKAAGESLAGAVSDDPSLAARALSHLSRRGVESLNNIEATVELTYEELLSTPSIEPESLKDTPNVAEEFVRRWERNAEIASTEEARSRWAKVLAQEIRRPGSFSARSLRTIDETEPALAEFFAHLCTKRIGNFFPEMVIHGWDAEKIANLKAAGLLTGELSASMPLRRDRNGVEWWSLRTGNLMIGLPKEFSTETLHLHRYNERYQLSIMALTHVGQEIAQLFPYDETENLLDLARAIAINASVQVQVFSIVDDVITPKKSIRAL